MDFIVGQRRPICVRMTVSNGYILYGNDSYILGNYRDPLYSSLHVKIWTGLNIKDIDTFKIKF